VSAGPKFRELEEAWMAGVAAMARAGARVIADDAFLGAAVSQQRWQHRSALVRPAARRAVIGSAGFAAASVRS
jgi:hypothetical protein